MKKMKHLLAVLLTLALALSLLAGCAGTPVSTGDAGTTAAPETTAARRCCSVANYTTAVCFL